MTLDSSKAEIKSTTRETSTSKTARSFVQVLLSPAPGKQNKGDQSFYKIVGQMTNHMLHAGNNCFPSLLLGDFYKQQWKTHIRQRTFLFMAFPPLSLFFGFVYLVPATISTTTTSLGFPFQAVYLPDAVSIGKIIFYKL